MDWIYSQEELTKLTLLITELKSVKMGLSLRVARLQSHLEKSMSRFPILNLRFEQKSSELVPILYG